MTKISQKLRKKFHNKSFTLLEVIIAIFVITVGVIGGIFAIQQTIVLASYSSSRLTAAYLAQEGIEIVRNIRDTNWLEGEDWRNGLGDGQWQADYNDQNLTSYDGGSFLYIQTTNGFYGYDSGTPTKFKRKITITTPPPPLSTSTLEVLVEINWQERGKSYSFPVKEHLYNWYY